MSNIEHVDTYAGMDRTLTLHARTRTNVVRDLTDYTVTWFMGRPPIMAANSVALVTKTGTVTDAATGTFTVAIDAADTADLAGDYEHMAKATSSAGGVIVVVVGRFRVRPTMAAT